MPSNLVSALCLGAGLLVCAAPALTQNYDPDRVPSSVDAQQREACTPDVMRLCNDYVPDIPDIVACLKRQRLNLSPACGEVFGVTEAERQPAPPPPAKDAAKKTPAKKAAEKKTPAKAGAPLSLTTDAAKAAK
jgi:hypothetical protein